MKNALKSILLAGTFIWSVQANAQFGGELNLLTDLGTPFPPGCLSIDLPQQPANPDILVDQIVNMPSVNSNNRDQPVRVQVWRVACADEGFSVVMVRMDPVNNDAIVVVPQVFAEAGSVQEPFHEAQLMQIPGSGNVGATGGILPVNGQAWMLGVNPISIDGQTVFVPEDYNATFTMELNWGSYSGASTEGVVFLLLEFEPTLDPPQFDEPVLNGRYTGQWVLDGAPRQGLVLQIAEQIDENFVFAIFFTYLNGQPIWVVGNTTPDLAQPGPVTIEMATLENGAFISNPTQPPRDDVISSNAGSITIEVIDCNRIRVTYDFSPLGQGTGSMELDRLVRIAGYDCNPWAD